MAKQNNNRNNQQREQVPNKTNEQIRCKMVMMVGEGFEQPTQMPTHKAMEMAKEQGLDLVMMAEKEVPVCKIMDYKKFLYDRNKKPKQPKPKKIKEVRFTPNTGDGDLAFKTNHIIGFLKDGHKVKIFVFFRGREMAFQDRGKEILLKVSVAVEDFGVAETLPKIEGKKMHMTLKPKNK